MKLLDSNIKRYGNKIKREENEQYIRRLFGYYQKTLYLLDIYNELGSYYNINDKNIKDLLKKAETYSTQNVINCCKIGL